MKYKKNDHQVENIRNYSCWQTTELLLYGTGTGAIRVLCIIPTYDAAVIVAAIACGIFVTDEQQAARPTTGNPPVFCFLGGGTSNYKLLEMTSIRVRIRLFR